MTGGPVRAALFIQEGSLLIDIDGSGEVEATATALTLVIYEQEFKGDLIKDVFGKHKADAGSSDSIDFTVDNWVKELQALWAMVATAYELKYDRGDAAPNDRPKPFKQWVRGIGKVNFRQISDAVVSEAWDGFFHTGAAASE